MVPELRCRGTNQDGSECAAPAQLVDPSSGYCRGHDPALRDELRQQGKRGGEKMAARFRRKALADEELPPLDSPQAAERWSEVVGRAVATGRLSPSGGQAVMRAVSEFLRSHEAGAVRERLEVLQEQLAELRGSRLEAVQ